jgi:uncharacterized membrane protein required for colicin V production
VEFLARTGYAGAHEGVAAVKLSTMNWFDLAVVVALGYGVWSGVRAGLMGEIIRLVGLVLMVVLALQFFDPLGGWLQATAGGDRELWKLAAFVGIAVTVFLATLGVKAVTHRWMKKRSFSAAVENVGGGVAGAVRMTMIMVLVSVLLCLIGSEFWFRQVGRDSAFGSFVVEQVPAVAERVDKGLADRIWFLDEIQRRPDPGLEQDRDPARR